MASSSSKTPPSPSLYVRNIPSKIKKPELRRQLYCLFNVYGKVIDVVATRRDSMRGQAFVVFRDLASSTSALRALDGFDFYGSALALDYARSKSKASVIEELGPEALFDPNVLASMKGDPSSSKSASKAKVTFSSAAADLQSREKKRARDEAKSRNGGVAADGDDEEGEDDDAEAGLGDQGQEEEDGDEVRAGKRRKSEAIAASEEQSDSGEEMEMGDSDDEEDLGAPLPAPGSVPNNLLFCGELPPDVSEDQLGVLFQQHAGFKDVQLLPASQERGAFAFVEFQSSKLAGAAREALDGFQLGPEKRLDVKWAKRA